MLRLFVTTLLFCLVTPLAAANIETGDPALDAAFVQILDRDFDVKVQGVAALAATGQPEKHEPFQPLPEGFRRGKLWPGHPYQVATDRLRWYTALRYLFFERC